MTSLKKLIRKYTPNKIILAYHFSLAKLASILYDNPSKKLYVIGITGTKGKTSTANFVWSVLNAAGLKAGQIGTANFRLGNREMLNNLHMTMPGPFTLQKMLSEMVDSGCTYVVMEVTSEGIKLFRDKGIIFDSLIFTNLTPEHLPSHGGSFENYKNTKGKLFAALKNYDKNLNGKNIERAIIANYDDSHKDYFLQFRADKKITYGLNNGADWKAENITETADGVDFILNGQPCHISMLGKFNVYNALPAMALAKEVLGLSDSDIQKGISNLKLIEGRMEQIKAGQKFTVIVDYAHEKVSMNAVLDSARKIAGNNKVIVLLGAEGGGRDKAKRPAMGEAAAKKADYVVCSNVDPYDDDPREITEDIARASEQFGKVRDKNLFVIVDRREGIAKALKLANPGDVVLITGKGAEQSMILAGRTIPWDDRTVVKEELAKIRTR